MIKLNWYALTKPHVVHRYYRVKEKAIARQLREKTFLAKGPVVYRCIETGRPLHETELKDAYYVAWYINYIWEHGHQVLPYSVYRKVNMVPIP